jgi:hypothetical protein
MTYPERLKTSKEVKVFSERNIKRMFIFYKKYSILPIVPQTVAQLPKTDSASVMTMDL